MKINTYLKPTALSLALGMVLASHAAASDLTDQLIIKYKQGNGPTVYDSPQNLQNLSVLAGVSLAHARYMYDGSQVLKLTDNFSDIKIAETIFLKLEKSNQIEWVEEDKLLQRSFIPDDNFYNLQWHYYEAIGGINLENAWDVSTGFGVTIAVLDTGYRPHVDLAANIVGGYDMIDNAFIGNDGDTRDADPQDPGDWTTVGECGGGLPTQDRNSSWHGTHVAGTIAAVTNNSVGVAGVAFDAMVVPVRVLGKCGGFTSDIADGMVWASGGVVAGVPNNPNPAQVMNLSLGGFGPCSATSQAAIDTAVANGAVVVVAAGNSNADVSGFNPGNCNNVISVAATDRNADRAFYSNFGNLIDIAAPGGDVTVGTGQDGVASTLNTGTTTPGTDTYVYYQGTSMAAPHVAGVAGLMFEVNPTLTPAQVETAIQASARSFPGGSTCNTSNCGDGIIDAAAAIAAVNAVNDDPVAANDSASTNEDVMVSVAVLTGDSDPDQGDTLSVTSCTSASNGSVSQNGDNCEFTPSQDFNGQGSFDYAISDGNGGTDSASVTVTVNAVNDNPVAANDSASTNEDVMVSVAVLTGDSDVDAGDTLSVTSCSAPSNGAVSRNGDNCEFIPSQDFNGQGSFDYEISDGNGGTDSASVTVTVNAVNDEPSMVVNPAVYVNLTDIASPPTQNLACQFDFGPDDEDLSQAVENMNVSIVNDANSILIAVDVDNAGALSYSFTGSVGVAEVTVSLQDDGGTSDSGDDTSQDYTFTVNVQDYLFRDGFESDVCQ